MKFMEFINEDLSWAKNDFKLKKSSISDPNIQETIKIYAKAKGISFNDAEDSFKLMLDKQIKNLGVAKINKNAIENAAESVAFQLLQQLNPEDLDLSAYGIKDSEDLLDRDYFYDLTQYVLGENSQFFPLRNPFEKRAVKPSFFITPDHLPLIKDERLKSSAKNNCDTAFCTPNAEMVFSRKFSEQLAVSALINKVKPKSKKYQSNGGPIPDHYAYLEFVIMHELLHFSAGDHFYTEPMVKKIAKKYPKVAGRAHTILNYVGDFINNWTLAKSGYAQLPIGLFSEDVNYDKFDSYEDIISAVVEDLIDLSDDDFNKMKDDMEKGMDEHMDNPDDTPSQGGKDSSPETKDNNKNDQSKQKIYKVGDIVSIKRTGKKAQVTFASEPDENGKQVIKVEELPDVVDDKLGDILSRKYRNQNENLNEEITLTSDDIEEWNPDNDDSGDNGKPMTQAEWDALSDEEKQKILDDMKKNPKSGNGSPIDTGMKQAEDQSNAIDSAMKNNQNKVEKRDDGNNDAKSSLETKGDETDNDIGNKVGQGSNKLEFKETQTTINWKKILKKMIPSGDGDAEDTYAKMSRQATSSMVTAQQTGAGRVSPGEITVDSDKKGLVFIIDNSGSVMNVVNQFNQEILNLMKKNKKFLDNMYIIRFSSEFDVNKVNVDKMRYQEILNPHEMVDKKPKIRLGTEKSVKDLFSTSYGFGTVYSPQMHKVVELLHSQNMNIIMFTDDDLVNDKNANKFFKLSIKRKNSIAMFITDDNSYKNMTNKFGKYKWITVIK